MAKKISSKELFEGSLFGEQIEEAKALLKVVQEVQGEFKQYGKTVKTQLLKLNKESSEGIAELNKLTKDLEKNTKSFNKTKDEEAKIEAGIIKLMQEEEKARQQELKTKQEIEKQDQQVLKTMEAESKARLAEQKEIITARKEAERLQKIKEKELKQLKDGSDLYAKQSKALIQLKKDYKNLVLAGRGAEKETEQLLETIKNLDQEMKELDATVGDNFRSVGNYTGALEKTEKALDDLNNTAKAAGVFLLVSKLVEFGGELFGQSREGTLELQKALAQLTARAEVFIKSLIQAAIGLKDLIVSSYQIAEGRVKNTLISIEIAYLETINSIQKGLNSLPNVDFSKEIESTTSQIKALEAQTVDVTKANKKFDESIEKIKGSFDGDTDAMAKNIEIKLKYLQLAQNVEIANLKLQRSLVELTLEQEKQAIISEDDTRGFEERRTATLLWLKANEEVAKQQEIIAKNELEVSRIRLIGNLVSEGAIINAEADLLLQNKKIRGGKDVLQLLENENIARKVSSENEQAYTENFIAYQEAVKEAAITALDTQEKNSKLLSDDLEKELDILIDGADVRKTINERQIADDTLSLEKRKKIFADSQVLIDTSFERQKAVILEFGKERIKLNKELTESQKKEQLEILKNADINDLVATKEADILQQKIRDLGLSQIFEGRLFEVIKERQIATQDLIETQKELNLTEVETQEIQKDIIAQEETLKRLREAKSGAEFEKVEAQFEEERQKNRLEAIEEELKLVEDGSKRALELKQEYNEIEIDLEKKKLDDLDKLNEQRKKAFESTIQTLENISDEYYANENKKIEDNISASEKAEQQLIEAAQKGVQLSDESIAYERKKQAELAREKEQLAERQARAELLLASLSSLNANDGNVGKTITDIVALREFVKAFPLFFDGTEDTGAGGAVDNKSGFMAVLHPHERVMNREQNDRIKASLGSVTNEELTSMAEKYANNTLASSADIQLIQNIDYSQKFDSLQNEIRNLPKRMPETKLDYKPIQQAMIETVKKEGSINKFIHKTNRLF